jgi:hypothetical protein
MLDFADVPDLSLEMRPPANLQEQLDTWTYVGRLFRLGRVGAFPIPLMPVWSWLTCAVSLIPPLDTVINLVKASVLCGAIDPTARVYQTWTGFLREVAAASVLGRYGRVVKPILRDLAEGVDLEFEGVGIAITHEGDRHIWRKRKKRANDVVVMTARDSGSGGVHLVSEADLISFATSVSPSKA